MNAGKNFLIICVLFLVGCSDTAVSDIEKELSPSQDLFLDLWDSFDRNYAFFTLRNVNPGNMKTQGLQATKCIESDTVLFMKFCDILKQFGDAHINLEAEELGLYCNAAPMPEFFLEFPDNEAFSVFLEGRNEALARLGIEEVKESESGLFQYGKSSRGEWAYLRIKRFYGVDLSVIKSELTFLSEVFQEVENLITDIRANPGGNDETALLIAAPYYSEKEIAFIKQRRTGPNREDFSAPDTFYVEPREGLHFNPKRHYLLTNRGAGSSADVFALVMKGVENNTLVGTNTEGIFSDMHRDTLSNGWRFTLSNERYYSKEMKCFEALGVPVDIEAKNTFQDAAKGKDALIDTLASNN